MKTLLLFATLTASLCPLQATAKIINMPKVDLSANRHSIIRSAEVTDTATRFNMSLLGYPGATLMLDTMELVGSATGQKYPLLRSDGYEIGSQLCIDETGRYDFVFIFPRLDPTDTIVTMREPNMEIKKSAIDFKRYVHLHDSETTGKYTTHISGHHNGKSGFVGVIEETSSPAREEVSLWIPVENGKFSATFNTDKPVFYRLMDGSKFFAGVVQGALFLPGESYLECEFITDDEGNVSNTRINAPEGSMTKSINDYETHRYKTFAEAPCVILRDSLEKSRAYYLPKYYELMEALDTYPEKRDSLQDELREFYAQKIYHTPEGEAANAAVNNFYTNEFSNALVKEAARMNNLAGLFALVREVWQNHDVSRYVDAYRRTYLGMFPEHPYSKVLEELDDTFEPIVGNPFNDFTAPALFGGEEYTLSELVKGRPALIDLWASWCGPCRVTSCSMIPVYNDYASKGFIIVGVARENTSPALAQAAVKKDGYPWLNLVEIDDKGGIWALYRCPGAGGATFLIDKDGKIVAVDPTADEVRQYLETTLKSD